MQLSDLATIQLNRTAQGGDWVVKVKDIKEVNEKDTLAVLTLYNGEVIPVQQSVNNVQDAINALWDQYCAGRETDRLEITDGVTAPGAASGKARIYVDTSDGDLKVVFADGTVKLIVSDT
jgi:hypothetical protein